VATTPVPLLERDAELATLRSAVAEAAARRGSIVLLAGEAGIGKSSLVEAWAAAGRDARTLLGWCDDLLTSRTLGPFRDLARLVGGPLAEAVATADTAAVIEAVLRLLDDPLRPTVVILEDVHWADEATLDVVRYVGRRIAHLPAVLTLTFRDDELAGDHPLRSVLGALPGRHVHRLAPRPLSTAAVRTLLGGSHHDARVVATLTGGNPFFVTEVARSGDALPRSITDAVVARLRTLPPDSRQLVEQLSVVPGVVASGVARALGATPERLAPAEIRRVLEIDVQGVRFRHELARQVVERALPESVRQRYHDAVVEVLADADVDRAAILHHAVAAGRGDVIARIGPSAAEAASRAGAHRSALGHQLAVLAHTDLLDDEVHATIVEQHAWTLYSLHRFPAARDAAERLVALRRVAGEQAGIATALLSCSRMRWMAADPGAAAAALEEAAGLAAEAGEITLDAEVALHRLALQVLTGHHAESAPLADATLDLTRRAGRADLEALVWCYRGKARMVTGDVRGQEDLRTGIELARRTRHLEAAARGYANLTTHLVAAERWGEAAQAIAEALDFLTDHDLVSHRYNVLAQRGLLDLHRGRWQEAKAALDALLAAGPDAGVLRNLALGPAALLAVRRGDDDAADLVERALTGAAAAGAAHYLGPAVQAAVEQAWLSEDTAALARTVDEALAARIDGPRRSAVRFIAALAGLASVAVGEADEPYATALAGRWRDAARSWEARGVPYEQALALLASGGREELLEAWQLLDALGAGPAAKLARRRLRELGVRTLPRGPKATTRRHPAGLTERQAEVLALVAEGLTNAQVAQRLVVSTRTVDHHVAAVLQKLGVATRREAVAAAGFDPAPSAPPPDDQRKVRPSPR
jgi:ATP/maltotriose-dependent transcriptional regulator MalT